MTELPNDSWTAEQLGVFVQSSSKKWAVDGWYLGKAILLAKEKLPHGEFGKWSLDYLPHLSTSTINRLMNLAKKIKDPAKLDGKRLTAAYRELFPVQVQEEEQQNKPRRKKGGEGNGEGNGKEHVERDDPEAFSALLQRVNDCLDKIGDGKELAIDDAQLEAVLDKLLAIKFARRRRVA